jgi:hypothetical protein
MNLRCFVTAPLIGAVPPGAQEPLTVPLTTIIWTYVGPPASPHSCQCVRNLLPLNLMLRDRFVFPRTLSLRFAKLSPTVNSPQTVKARANGDTVPRVKGATDGTDRRIHSWRRPRNKSAPHGTRRTCGVNECPHEGYGGSMGPWLILPAGFRSRKPARRPVTDRTLLRLCLQVAVASDRTWSARGDDLIPESRDLSYCALVVTSPSGARRVHSISPAL